MIGNLSPQTHTPFRRYIFASLPSPRDLLYQSLRPLYKTRLPETGNAASTMAEAAQAPPTFKLVLVGDGGTGKVSSRPSQLLHYYLHPYAVRVWHQHCREALLTKTVDHLRQATLDRRVREEVYRHSWCRSSPSRLHNGMKNYLEASTNQSI